MHSLPVLDSTEIAWLDSKRRSIELTTDENTEVIKLLEKLKLEKNVLLWLKAQKFKKWQERGAVCFEYIPPLNKNKTVQKQPIVVCFTLKKVKKNDTAGKVATILKPEFEIDGFSVLSWLGTTLMNYDWTTGGTLENFIKNALLLLKPNEEQMTSNLSSSSLQIPSQ